MLPLHTCIDYGLWCVAHGPRTNDSATLNLHCSARYTLERELGYAFFFYPYGIDSCEAGGGHWWFMPFQFGAPGFVKAPVSWITCSAKCTYTMKVIMVSKKALAFMWFLCCFPSPLSRGSHISPVEVLANVIKNFDQ